MVLSRPAFWAALGVGVRMGCAKSPEAAPPSAPPPQPADTVAPAAPPAVEPIASAMPTAPGTATAASPAASTAELVPAAAPASSAKTAAHPAKTASATHRATPAGAKETPPSEGAAKPASCGEKGQPSCPLQGFMKGTVAPAAASGEGEPIAKALDQIAAHAPPGLSNWASIAKDGAAKARAGDLEGAKASCKSCHDQYKTRYKTDMRARPF